MTAATTVAEYDAQLRAWKLRLCEWVGLNPDEVYALNHSREVITWQAIEQQPEPKQGKPLNTSISGDGDTVTYSGEIYLGYPDIERMVEACGPKPQLLTREQELMLKGLAAERAEEDRYA